MLDAAFGNRAVYLRPTATLVVADLHVGRAAASDVEAPLDGHAALVDRLGALLEAFSPREVVFAGDVLHAFDRVPPGAAETLTGLLTLVCDAGADPVLVAGNHDSMLAGAVDAPVHDAYRLGETRTDTGTGDEPDAADGAPETLVCHGHVEPDDEAELYVVGHDHPTITIEGQRRPCSLYGPGTYRGGDVLLLPAFTPLAAGVSVNTMRTADFQSPLVTDVDALRPIVHDADRDETLTFPPLGRFRRLL